MRSTEGSKEGKKKGRDEQPPVALELGYAQGEKGSQMGKERSPKERSSRSRDKRPKEAFEESRSEKVRRVSLLD